MAVVWLCTYNCSVLCVYVRGRVGCRVRRIPGTRFSESPCLKERQRVTQMSSSGLCTHIGMHTHVTTLYSHKIKHDGNIINK